MPLLLRMLYGTGIREGEALNLKHKDISWDKEYLVLKSCKNGRDRIVPVSKSLMDACKDFHVYKQKQLIDTGRETYFFTALNGGKCQPNTVCEHFGTVLYKAGIPHKGRGKGPRLHGLRHTFCINALVKMSEAGMDLYYSTPILSAYVGHQSIEATNRYVRLVSGMYPALLDKVGSIYKDVIPGIGIEALVPDSQLKSEQA